MRGSSIRFIFTVAVFALCTFACKSNHPQKKIGVISVDLHKVQNAPAPVKTQAIPQQLHQVQQVQINPFLNYNDLVVEIAQLPEQRALELLDLRLLRLVGTATGATRYRALVQDPANRGYVLEIGAKIGPEHAKLTEITSNKVVFSQTVGQQSGKLERKYFILNMGGQQP